MEIIYSTRKEGKIIPMNDFMLELRIDPKPSLFNRQEEERGDGQRF